MKINVKRYISILCVFIIVLTGSSNAFAIEDISSNMFDYVNIDEERTNDETFSNNIVSLFSYPTNYTNTYKNTGDQAKDIVGVAKTQVGYKGNGDHTKYNYWYYNKKDTSAAWCAIFISWCANQAGISTSIIKKNARASGYSTNNMQNNPFGCTAHKFDGYSPLGGEIAFIDTDNDGISNHVGLVKSADRNSVYTIEGNTKSDTVKSYSYSKSNGKLNGTGQKIVFYAVPSYKIGKLSKPTITSCGATSSTEIKLEWNKVSDASKYKIVRTEVNSTNQKTFNDIADTRYTDKKLESGTTYYYKVYAINSDGKSSDASLVYKTYTKPKTPNQPKVSRDSKSQLTVSWDKVSGATSYWVYRRKYDESGFNKIADTTSTSYKDAGLASGTQYFYRVVAVRTGEIGLTDKRTTQSIKSDQSETKSHFTTGRHPDNNIDNDNPTNVILNWEEVKPKTKESYTYEIRRNGATIKTGVKGTTYTDTTATPGTIYKYEVKTEGASWTTDEFYAAPKIIDEISLSANDASSMQINWNKPKGSSDNLVYVIKRDGNEVGRTTNTWYIDSGLTAGRKYDYYVQVRDKDDNYVTSTYSKSATLQPPDLGTGFYASIVTKEGWLPLKTEAGNVYLGDAAGTADTLWRFDRDSDGSYKISSVANGSVLDATGWGNDAGTNVGVYNAHDDETKTNQRWYLFEENGGYVIIPSYNMGLVLDVSGGTMSAGTNIQLWTRHNGIPQIFWINRDDNLRIKSPTLSVQTDSSNTETKFYWNTVPAAVNYKLTIYQSGTLYKEETISGNEYSIGLPTGSYSAVVQASNHFESADSNTISFSLGCTSHIYGEWQIQSEASCMTDGIKYRQCTNCGQTEMEVVPKSNHNYTDFVKDATCTDDGEKYQICQNCGDKINIETIDALGHTFPDEWTLEKTATCNESGIESRVCSVCGAKEERSTECTDHEYELTEQIEPTLIGPGSRTYTCKICNGSYTEEYVPLVEEGTIDIGGTAASAGQTITIPVTISNNPGIAGFKFVLDYDKTVMTPKEITKGSLITSGTFATNLDEGLPVSELEDVAISWSDATNITEDGELFNIIFEVNSDAPDGKYVVSLDYDKGDVTAETYEDVMPDIHSNVIQIADVLKGDINLDGKVNSLDSTLLAKVLAHYKIELSEKQKEAANVFNDKDKSINTKDAVSLAQIIAGWENPIVDALSAINLFSEGNEPTITVESFEASAGEYIDVPVTITDNSGISGFSFTLNYDKDKLTPIAIEKADMLTDGNFESNLVENENGSELEYVTATWSDTDSLMEDGTLFSVMFEVNENAEVGETLPIEVSYGSDDICDRNLDSINTAVIHGKIDVIEYSDEDIGPNYIDDYVYFINDIAMQNSDGTSCEEFPVNGDFNLEVGIECMAEEYTPAIMLVAAYDENGCLISLKSVDITEEIFTEGVCEINIDESNTDIDTVSIFVWDSINGMMPLADTVII